MTWSATAAGWTAATYGAVAGAAWLLYTLLVHGVGRLGYYYRVLAFYLLIIPASLRGFVMCLFVPSSDRLAVAARWYYHSVAFFTGVSIKVTGEEELRSDRPCVYMVNHQSSLDMLCAGGWVPRRTVVIAKRSLRLVPFMGQFLTLADTIFLNRRNHESAMYSMERAGERLSKRRLSVIIFPEGTRSRSDGELLPFKKGGFNLAVAAQVPIVPVVMAQQKPIYDPARHRFLPGTIAVKVLPPVPTTGLTREDVPELADRVRDMMAAELRSLVAVPSGKF